MALTYQLLVDGVRVRVFFFIAINYYWQIIILLQTKSKSRKSNEPLALNINVTIYDLLLLLFRSLRALDTSHLSGLKRENSSHEKM